MSQNGLVIAIVQARMGSTRLPGKVLSDLAGAPMLQRQLERVQRATTLDQIVVATSGDSSDDPIAELCAKLGVPVFRGDLNDVLSRFAGAITEFDPEIVVRITADCPLLSPSVIDSVVSAFKEEDVDYLSNTLQPTFPDGVDVEVVRADVLLDLSATSTDLAEREHVTLGVYRQPEKYAVANFAGDVDLSDLRWTVDNPGDFEFVQWVYQQLMPDNPQFDIDDVLALLESNPSRSRTSADSKRNAALDGLDTGAMLHQN